MYGILRVRNGSLCTKKNSALYPSITYATVAPAMDESRSGMMVVPVRSIISTSSVKSIPAMGARNIPAMPAAAPHPTSIIRILGDRRNACPRFEPMAAPVKTIGPSAPTEPPKPIVIEEDTSEAYILWRFSLDLRWDMA